MSPTVRHRFACLAARWRRDQGLCTGAECEAEVLASAARCGLVDGEDPFAAQYFVDVPVTGGSGGGAGLQERCGRPACLSRPRGRIDGAEADGEQGGGDGGDCQGREPCNGWLRRCKAVRDLLAAARHETAPQAHDKFGSGDDDDCDSEDEDEDEDDECNDDDRCDDDDRSVLICV